MMIALKMLPLICGEKDMKSDKSVLVIDTPKDCIECPLFAFECCHVRRKEIPMENITQGIKPEWCPLRPLPKIIPYKKGEATRIKWHDIGYNNCIRELLGESWKMEGETE